MFYKCYSDPLNLNRGRNTYNTRSCDYNCAGFALRTFSWYCPNEKDTDVRKYYQGKTEAEISEKTLYAVKNMLHDFEGRLRLICDVAEADLQTEYVVAFRIDPNHGDFHFVRRGCRGNWYHKRGRLPEIEQMDECEVFCEDWVFGPLHYNGPLVLFAVLI